MAKPEEQGGDALDSWEDIDNQISEIGKGGVAVGKKLYEIDTNRANSTSDGPRASGSGAASAYNGPSTSVNAVPSQVRLACILFFFLLGVLQRKKNRIRPRRIP